MPPPAPFRDVVAREERLTLLASIREGREHLSQTSPPPRNFGPASEETVVALDRLFRSKCAFCESKTTLSVHLFRPPDEAEPLERSEIAHLYYVWLRTDWSNVYGVCNVCARVSGRKFPVRGSHRGGLPTLEELEQFANENYGLWRWRHNDKRLLLDPCEDRSFARHLTFDLMGRVHAFTESGAQTIATFNLDREDLVRARASAFEAYITFLRNELSRGIDLNGLNFPAMEYGGGWYLLLRRLIQKAGQRLQQNLNPRPEHMERVVRQTWESPLGRNALEAAFEDVSAPIVGRTVARPTTTGPTRQLSSIHVTNFKAFESLQINIPTPIAADSKFALEAEAASLLVLGENAAGKSSILEAVALALSDEKIRLRLKRPPRSFILDPDLMGSMQQPKRENGTVKLTFDDRAELTLTISDRFIEEGVTDRLPPVFAYGAFRQYGTDTRSRLPSGRVITLFRSEALLANPEAWLLGLPDDQFAMVIRALQQILMIEGDFEVVRRDNANHRCLIVTRVGEGDDHHEIETPLRVVSSGFRSVLAMVCDILAGLLKLQRATERRSFAELDAVLLIDEIEAHLHPRWKMQIMTALRRVLPKATIIATTHDPLCLRGMHDGEVVLLNRVRKPDEETAAAELPVFVETVVQLPNVENLTIEQLLTSDFFSMFSTDSPVTEHNLARLGSLLAKRSQGELLSDAEEGTIEELRQHVIDAIPLGSSEVQRLIQEAVFEYLENRRGLSSERLQALRSETRDAIRRALEEF